MLLLRGGWGGGWGVGGLIHNGQRRAHVHCKWWSASSTASSARQRVRNEEYTQVRFIELITVRGARICGSSSLILVSLLLLMVVHSATIYGDMNEYAKQL